MSEVEQRLTLVTARYRWHESQSAKGSMQIPLVQLNHSCTAKVCHFDTAVSCNLQQKNKKHTDSHSLLQHKEGRSTQLHNFAVQAIIIYMYI